MPSVPLPFLVAVLLLILLARIARGDDETPANRPFLALIVACIVQSVLIGLRWGYGIEEVRYVIPVLAALLPPLVYASFGGLAQTGADPPPFRIGLHALPAGLVAALAALWPAPIDLVIVAVFLGYAAALLRLARAGPDALGLARLEGAVPAYRALQLAVAVLVVSAVVDLIVAVDFEWARGEHAGTVIGISNLVALFMLGLAAAVAGRTTAPAEHAEPAAVAPSGGSEDDKDVVEAIDDLMRTQGLFRDANLNLSRLARKAGLPARRISAAINRTSAKSVSQYVNGYRIAEACRLLTETDQPVTTIMFDAGFQTKSNFNREFRRVTGMSPMAWRAKSQLSTGLQHSAQR
jgi:AraC-like DNA-binding protein